MHGRWAAEAARHWRPQGCDLIGSEKSVKAENMCSLRISLR